MSAQSFAALAHQFQNQHQLSQRSPAPAKEAPSYAQPHYELSQNDTKRPASGASMRQPSIIKAPIYPNQHTPSQHQHNASQVQQSRNQSQRNSCSANSFNVPGRSDSRSGSALGGASAQVPSDTRERIQLLEKMKTLKSENKKLVALLKESERLFYSKLQDSKKESQGLLSLFK